MRKIAEILSLAALAALAFITVNAFYGPHRLPARIPTHYNAAGQPNGWGSPAALLFLPFIATGLWIMLTVMSRFRSMFNYPVKVTEENRVRLEPLALSLLAWVKAEMLLLFAWIDFGWIQAIRNPGHSPGMMPVAISLLVLFASCIGFIVAMNRAAKPAR